MDDEESAPDYVDHVLRNHYPEHFHPSQVSALIDDSTIWSGKVLSNL